MYASLLTRGIARSRPLGHMRCLASKPHPPTSSLSKQPPNSTSTPPSPILSLDFQPAAVETESQRTGAKSSKDSLSSIERRRRYLGRMALGVFVMAFGAQVMYMGREWEEHELKSKKLVCIAPTIITGDAL